MRGASSGRGSSGRVLRNRQDIDAARVSDHVRALMHTCWRLGGLSEFTPLHLRAWVHTLGYRGHILTKSRAYSNIRRPARRPGRTPWPRNRAWHGHRCSLTLCRLRPHPRCGTHRRGHRRRPGHEPQIRAAGSADPGGCLMPGSSVIWIPDKTLPPAERALLLRILFGPRVRHRMVERPDRASHCRDTLGVGMDAPAAAATAPGLAD
ncbi:replication initiator [Streptomyces sp. NPDC002742]|uniref:replication initiator n=1 Tax=Streptomyces sp. NPDC002742 TaxID=3364663 RepID=UPI00367833B5